MSMIFLTLAVLAAIGGVVVMLVTPQAWLGGLGMTVGFGVVAIVTGVRLKRPRSTGRSPDDS